MQTISRSAKSVSSLRGSSTGFLLGFRLHSDCGPPQPSQALPKPPTLRQDPYRQVLRTLLALLVHRPPHRRARSHHARKAQVATRFYICLSRVRTEESPIDRASHGDSYESLRLNNNSFGGKAAGLSSISMHAIAVEASASPNTRTHVPHMI